MNELPPRALSVRQPWAWAIIHAGKNIENRGHFAITKGGMRPGRIAINASKGMTRDEYESASDFMCSIGVVCPPAAELIRGGIIGSVQVVDIVSRSNSPWFFGPRGLVLRDPQACEPRPCSGQLGYFDWKESGALELPLKWMLPKSEVRPAGAAMPTSDLFADSAGQTPTARSEQEGRGQDLTLQGAPALTSSEGGEA